MRETAAAEPPDEPPLNRHSIRHCVSMGNDVAIGGCCVGGTHRKFIEVEFAEHDRTIIEQFLCDGGSYIVV